MLDKRISIDAALYFSIKNSELFGGKGSLGYMASSFEGVKNIEELDSDFVDRQISIFSGMGGVPIDCVSVISKEEYKEGTEDCDDDEEEDYDEL